MLVVMKQFPHVFHDSDANISRTRQDIMLCYLPKFSPSKRESVNEAAAPTCREEHDKTVDIIDAQVILCPNRERNAERGRPHHCPTLVALQGT